MKEFLLKLKQNKRFLRIALVALGLIILAIVLIRKNGDDAVVKYEITNRTVSDSIELAGTVDVDRRVDLGFATSGRVTQILVKEGERVRKGQVIARVDQNSLSAQLIQARANELVTRVDTDSGTEGAADNLETEKVRQEALVNGAYQEYLSGDLQAYPIDELTRSVTPPTISGTYQGTQEGEYTITLYASASDSGYSYRLSGLETGRDNAFTRQAGKLGTRGLYVRFADGANYNNTTWVVPVPNTRSSSYASRKSAYNNARTLRDQILTSTENEYRRLTGGTSQSRSAAVKNQARAQVQAVYAELANGAVTAPFDGIVALNNLEVGQVANAYETYITIVGNMDMQLELNVPEIYINKVTEGNEVEVTLDAFPENPFVGIVEKIDIIDTVVDGVPVYQTLVSLKEPGDKIRIGMNAKARILTKEVKDVLAVPTHYLVDREGTKASVLIIDPETQKQTSIQIETGFEGNDGYVEVVKGLALGDVIIRPNIEE